MPELYTEFLALRARQRTLEVIANNIANASTTGFKADRVLYRSIEAAAIEQSQSQNAAGGSTKPAIPADVTVRDEKNADVVVTSGATNFSAGAIRQTGRSLDVAISGDGFLVVQTPRGERYTRAGALSLDASGQLVTLGGDLVVGQNGPVTIPRGDISIADDGAVSVNGQDVGRLKLVRFADPRNSLIKEGTSLFSATAGARPLLAAPQTRVIAGALEVSNVNTIEEVAAMIQNNREFDAIHRLMTMKLRGEDSIGKI